MTSSATRCIEKCVRGGTYVADKWAFTIFRNDSHSVLTRTRLLTRVLDEAVWLYPVVYLSSVATWRGEFNNSNSHCQCQMSHFLRYDLSSHRYGIGNFLFLSATRVIYTNIYAVGRRRKFPAFMLRFTEDRSHGLLL